MEELDKDPKRFTPRGIHAEISRSKNQLVEPGDVLRAGRLLLRPDGRRGLRGLPAPALRLERARLRRPPHADRGRPRALPRGARTAGRRRSAGSSWTSTRTRTTRSTGCSSSSPASTATSSRSAIPTSRSTRSAAPTSATCSSSSRTSRAPAAIALEQNYRSTNRILQAANAVIANNRERKPKNLWSEIGEGEPVRVLEVEDEHAEARFVASEISGLVDGDHSASEIAIFYRTNAQSRVIEEIARRVRIPFQVIGGPRFYERAEVRDAVAYLQAIDNPSDTVSLLRIANRAAARRGGHQPRAAPGLRRRAGDHALGRDRPRRRGGRRAPRRCAPSASCARSSTRSPPRRRSSRFRTCSSGSTSSPATSRRSRPSGRSRRRAAWRT